MKNCKSMLCVLGFALACSVHARAGDEPKLTFKFTKANIPGALQTYTYGVNNAGVMVGSYRDKSSGHGYILNGKKLTKLDDPKGQPGSTIGRVARTIAFNLLLRVPRPSLLGRGFSSR